MLSSTRLSGMTVGAGLSGTAVRYWDVGDRAVRYRDVGDRAVRYRAGRY